MATSSERSKIPGWFVALAVPIIFALHGLPLAPASIAATGEPAPGGGLTFEQRVAAQEAIERLYHVHQLGTKRPFEQAVSRALLERKVRTYLRQSVALEQLWDTPITGDMLRREVERMARETRLPGRLQSLFDALGNDPVLVEECLARSVLADRLARSRFVSDRRIHADARRRAEGIDRTIAGGRLDPGREHPLRTVHDLVSFSAGIPGEGAAPASLDGDPSRTVPVREISAGELERRRASLKGSTPRDRALTRVEETRHAFVVRALLEESADRLRIARYEVPKRSWDAWWREKGPSFDLSSALPVVSEGAPLPEPAGRSGWNGASAAAGPVAGGTEEVPCLPDDSWDAGGLNMAPMAQQKHTAIWTGTEMITWGGFSSDNTSIFAPLPGGSRYDPGLDHWTIASYPDPGPARRRHTAVWTGTLMIIWGGDHHQGDPDPGIGSRYDPATDSWSWTSSVDAPEERKWHTAVWTGSEMIVWGGRSPASCPEACYQDTGGRYDPVSDSWSPLSTNKAPSPRAYHTAVWTGSEMIVWGGEDADGPMDTGARYTPSNNRWRALTPTGAPSARAEHTAVWTGSEMIVWGGCEGPSEDCRTGAIGVDTGGRYDPIADSWVPTETAGAPGPRGRHTALWTGSEMIVWGGRDGGGEFPRIGGRYDPVGDAWTPMSTTLAPPPRYNHVAFWTGSFGIVWGGVVPNRVVSSSGGRYVLGHAEDGDGDGVSECGGDCNDASPESYPGAAEICDGLDNDCDGTVDEGAHVQPYYPDSDGDGYGDQDNPVLRCRPLYGLIENGEDCDDQDPNTYPGAPEFCDGSDNDCDGTADEGGSPPGPATGLSLGGPDHEVLSWPPQYAEFYDLMRGDLRALRATGGDFAASSPLCLENDYPDEEAIDQDTPPAGEAFYYLYRSMGCGVRGTYDSNGTGQQGTRDDDLADSPCP